MEQRRPSDSGVGLGEILRLTAAELQITDMPCTRLMTCASCLLQVLVCGMTMFVGISMAEIVSSLPSSGGPYFWCVAGPVPKACVWHGD